MSKLTLNRVQIFCLRIRQIMRFYELNSTEFATKLNVDPEKFKLLLAGKSFDLEIVLAIIDQLHHTMKLDFDWFLNYDLEALPDLQCDLFELFYDRDNRSARIEQRRQTIRWMMHGLIDELVPSEKGDLFTSPFSSDNCLGKIEG